MVELTKAISPHQMEWRNNKSINDWTRQNGLISDMDMIRWRKKIDEDPSIEMFGVLYNGQNVGTCGLTGISPVHGSAEFSLLIDPSHRGVGLGTWTLKKLIAYGFDHLRLHCIWGETFEKNPAKRIFVRLGFQEEGKLRSRYFKNGKYTDTHILSILRPEFESIRDSWGV